MIPTLSAIVQAYHDVYGKWPENYGKFPKPVPVEPPAPPTPEPPKPIKPPFDLKGWLLNRKWHIVGITIIIILAILIWR